MSNWNKKICETCNITQALTYKEEKVECYKCKIIRETSSLGKEAISEGETSHEQYIVCPHCGSHYGEDEMNESCDVECPQCEKYFHVEVEYSISYSTSKN